MSRFICFSFLFLLSWSAFSQITEVEGAKTKLSSSNSMSLFILENGQIMGLQKDNRLFKMDKFHFNFYNELMNVENIKSIDLFNQLDFNTKKDKYLGPLLFNGKMYIITIKGTEFAIHEIDVHANPIELKHIVHWDYSTSNNSSSFDKPYVTYAISPDDKYLSILIIPNRSKEDKLKTFVVFDENFDRQTDKTVETDIVNLSSVDYDFKVSDEGTIYYLIGKKAIWKGIGEAGQNEIYLGSLKLGGKNHQVQDIILQPGEIIYDLKLCDLNDHLKLAGFYTDSKANSLSGLFSLNVDKEDLHYTKIHKTAFTGELGERSIIGDRSMFSTTIKLQKDKRGKVWFVGESKYYSITITTDKDGRKSKKYSYHPLSVYLAKLNENSSHAWVQKAPERYPFSDKNYSLTIMKSSISSKGINIFYIDNKKHVKKMLKEGKSTHPSFTSSKGKHRFFCVHVNDKGKQTYYGIYRNKVKMIPYMHLAISDKNGGLYGFTSKNKKFVMRHFKSEM